MDKLKLKELSEQLFKCHVEISGVYNEYAKSCGLTYACLKVLAIIIESNECTQKTITQLTYLPKQTVKFAEEIINKAKEIEYRALDSIGEQKRNALIEAIKTFRDNLKII